ncbi:hypothetical protein HY496_03605 [Candidatus Woesearchaeota archaeon]|nr:hypothetical protein [Candidatus Woesearchaeota archaeon]
MKKGGLQKIIELLEQSPNGDLAITEEEFLHAFRKGVKEEPEQFTKLVKTQISLIGRIISSPEPDFVRNTAVNLVAVYCFLADHGGDALKSPEETYADPTQYGPAMNLMAKYVGVKGWPLLDFLVNIQYRQ